VPAQGVARAPLTVAVAPLDTWSPVAATHWDFGDGTPQGQGASVVHAFARAGVYTVVETIRDKDGQMRTGRTHVTALERTVAMAVPGDARAALLIPTPWARLPIHREVATKLSLGASLDELARSVGQGAGFERYVRRLGSPDELTATGAHELELCRRIGRREPRRSNRWARRCAGR